MHDDIRKLIEQKNFSDIENVWMEMIEKENTPLGDFFEIAKDLKKNQASEHAFVLLEVLASHFESIKGFNNALAIYKQMPYYTSDDRQIRKKLGHIYRQIYKKSPYIEEYLERSGFEKGEHFFKSLDKLEEFLKYDVGNFFYFEKYGIGMVKDVIPSKKELVIDFEKEKRYFIKFDIARGLLIPISEEHFLYKKYKNITELKELADQNPVGLIKFILVSFNEQLSASQIKAHLEGILEKEEISKWWEKIRKRLETDENIKVSGKTLKTYSYIESIINKVDEAITAFEKAELKDKYILADECAKKNPEAFKQVLPKLVEIGNKVYQEAPALALDILLLCKEFKIPQEFSYTEEELFKIVEPGKIIKDLTNLNHQRFALKHIKEKNPDDWVNIFKKFILSCDDFKLLNEIEDMLNPYAGELQEIYQKIFLLPNNYPQQFLWLLKKLSQGELKEYLIPKNIPKILNSLSRGRAVKPIIMKILNLEDFDKILKVTKVEEAKQILFAVQNNKNLAEYEKKSFLRIIEFHFPQFFKKEEDVIYTTETALNRKKEELNHILTIEIPQNKKEISRAREFGDLSENFEYKSAKERQDQLYQKVRDIEAELTKVRIIESSKIDTGRVSIGTKVTLKNLPNKELVSWTILGRWDGDLAKNIISNEAPMARSLLGKSCGEKITLNDIAYEIVKIERGL